MSFPCKYVSCEIPGKCRFMAWKGKRPYAAANHVGFLFISCPEASSEFQSQDSFSSPCHPASPVLEVRGLQVGSQPGLISSKTLPNKSKGRDASQRETCLVGGTPGSLL